MKTDAPFEESKISKRAVISALPLISLCGFSSAHANDKRKTPYLTKGPFYPASPSRGEDENLLIADGGSLHANGELLSLSGRIMTPSRKPIENALVEIWQCDHTGHYLVESTRQGSTDVNFQGYGKTRTGIDGEFRFLTIKPVPYPGRTPHIHFKVSAPNKATLFTQMFCSTDAEENERDTFYRSLSVEHRGLVTASLRRPTNTLSKWTTQFDIFI